MINTTTPSYAEIARIERDARRLQALTLAASFRAFGRGIAHAPQAFAALLTRRAHG